MFRHDNPFWGCESLTILTPTLDLSSSIPKPTSSHALLETVPTPPQNQVYLPCANRLAECYLLIGYAGKTDFPSVRDRQLASVPERSAGLLTRTRNDPYRSSAPNGGLDH